MRCSSFLVMTAAVNRMPMPCKNGFLNNKVVCGGSKNKANVQGQKKPAAVSLMARLSVHRSYA
jgi:CDGSH-type Zn-finger protein